MKTVFRRNAIEAVEYFFNEGWTDGLPVIPPTPKRVLEMIRAGDREADEVIGTLPERGAAIAVWQAATCAVMAGCLPAYFPVVLATWEAAFDPRFNLHAVLSSSGGPAITAVVSGPYASEIGMNAGAGAFGPGNRANATIGRAIRLGAITALEAIPGRLDAASLGHAGKYTAHFAERDPHPPWLPLRQQLGFGATDTTVTLIPSEAPRQVAIALTGEAESVLRVFASCLRNPSQNGTGKQTYYLVVFGPEHSLVVREAGWSQAEVRRFLADESRISPAELEACGVRADYSGLADMTPGADGKLSTVTPRNVACITAGGYGAGWSAAFPSWAEGKAAKPVTRAVRVPGRPIAHALSTSEIDFI